MSFLSNLFGKTKVPAPTPVTPASFNGGGLSGSFSGNGYNVSPDANRSGTVGAISDNFGQLGDAYGGLGATVAPGYNDLLRTRLAGIDDSARKSIGDLRQNLQSRRVLGSSFGQDTITRGNAEFGRLRDAATADTFLQSLKTSTDLIGKQYEAYNQKFQTGLTELNLEAGIASKLSGDASNILAANAKAQNDANQFNAKMSNDQAGGFGSFLGRIALAPVTGGGSLLGNGIKGLFG